MKKCQLLYGGTQDYVHEMHMYADISTRSGTRTESRAKNMKPPIRRLLHKPRPLKAPHFPELQPIWQFMSKLMLLQTTQYLLVARASAQRPKSQTEAQFKLLISPTCIHQYIHILSLLRMNLQNPLQIPPEPYKY